MLSWVELRAGAISLKMSGAASWSESQSLSTPADTRSVISDEESDGEEGYSFASPHASSVGKASDIYSNNIEELNNPLSVLDVKSSKRTSGSGSSNFSANISSYGEDDTEKGSESQVDSDHGASSSSGSLCESTEDEATMAVQSTVADLPQHGQLAAYLRTPRQTDYAVSKRDNVFIQESSLDDKATNNAELVAAIESGDLALVKQLTRASANLETGGPGRRSPLHIACSLGHFEMVRLLIKAGCNIDACSENGRTPLHEACIGGHYKVIQLLLSKVSDLDHPDNLGQSAAHLCSLHGEVECLTLLCNQGCDLCMEDGSNRSAVHLAAMNDHPRVIQTLLERGVELEAQDKDGKTPAHYAARHSSLKCLQVLLTNDVDITQGTEIKIIKIAMCILI